MPRSPHWRFAALLLLLAGLLGVFWTRQRPATKLDGKTVSDAEARAFLDLEARESEADQTVWAKELDAQRHEDVFLALWDKLNVAPEPLAALADFPFEELRFVQIPASNFLETLPHGIHRFSYEMNMMGSPSGIGSWTAAEWRVLLMRWRSEGWRLGRTSWHEIDFTPATGQGAANSLVAATAQLHNETTGERAVLRGKLNVEWKTAGNSAVSPTPKTIVVMQMEWLARTGPPPFAESFTAELTLRSGSLFADPLLVQDLDGDGLSEIVLVGANKLFRNERGTFREEPLAELPAGRVFAAVLADLNGDGRADLLVASAEGLFVFDNDGHGRFSGPGAGGRGTTFRRPHCLSSSG